MFRFFVWDCCAQSDALRRVWFAFTTAVACGVIPLAGQARASIILTTGAFHEIAPPNSVAAGALTSNTEIRAFLERQNVMLNALVVVDFIDPGFYNSVGDLPLVSPSIAADTAVDSYYFHGDPVGSALTQYAGSVTFDTDILGVIMRNASSNPKLDITDITLGHIGTTYPAAGNESRDLELGSGGSAEQITLSADHRTLTLHLATAASLDQFRVLTVGSSTMQAVPEPATLSLALFGLLVLVGYAYQTRRTCSI